jgi:transcriptional regulator with XRE-family HTH domain
VGKLQDDVSARLHAVMAEVGATSYEAMAELCDTSKSSINNWLNKNNLPRVPEMSRLCDKTGVTLDWIYRGAMVAMDPKLGVSLDRRLNPQGLRAKPKP